MIGKERRRTLETLHLNVINGSMAVADRWETEEAMASHPTKKQQRGLKDECLTESTLRTWLEIGGKKQESRYV